MTLPFIIFAAALFIDGATDAANAVTGAVSSKVMTLKGATALSAVLSFLGCLVFCLFFPSVAESSSAAFAFPEKYAPVAVTVSLFSVALWSGVAWLFGLPTSEGHALISAGAGAALSLGGKISLWRLILILVSVIPAALLGAALSVIASRLLKKKKDTLFKIPIILSAALSSFFHGAQDGQKFLALALSASLLSEDLRETAVIASAVFMGLGTLFGGRIIKKMGNEMADADRKAALSSDLGSAAALALLTAAGVPASTTHIKMTSLAAASHFLGGKTDKDTFLLMIAAWFATFPVCFALSFLLSKLFL